jgi:surface antigen Omp85-like protein
MSRPWSAALIGCLLSGLPAWGAEPGASGPECPGGLDTKLIPLPVYATLPNEGDTFGVMPVFLRVCDAYERTESIIAPSVTWNDVIQWTGTLRWFHYPSDDQTLTFIASVSTRINSNVLLLWRDVPREAGATTTEVDLRWQRNVFYRFFGLGPDTPPEDESSYTRVRGHAAARRGLNFGGNWNAGITVLFDRDVVQDLGVPGLPLSRREFPSAPGMGGSTLLGQTVDVRFDTRERGETSERGFFAGLTLGLVEGLAGSPAYSISRAQVRALVPETEWMTAAARFDWRGVSSPRVPFYAQSTLGGAYLVRGFTEDRFIDQSAWTVEMEQRIRLFQTHIYGVTADWRIDPFVAVGQVYSALDEAFSHPRVAAGVGFRAWVHPNVVGRVDVADGGEGWKVYVEIGYPY